MFKPKLNFYINIDDKSKEALIVGVCENKEFDLISNEINEEGIKNLEKNSYSVLVTDKVDLIRLAYEKKNFFFRSIYLGNSRDVEDMLENLVDIWPADEPDDILRTRVSLVADKFVYFYKAWLYEHLMNTALDSVPDMVWFKDKEGAHWNVNKKFCEIVHKTKEECEGRGHYFIWDISPEEYASGEFVCMESEEETMKAGKTCVFDEPLKTSEGMKQLITYKTPYYNQFGEIMGTVGFARDVTNFNNLGIELSILVDNIPYPMLICDTNWNTIRMSASFMELALITNKDEVENFDYKKWKKEKLVPVSDRSENYVIHSRSREYKLVSKTEENYYILDEQEIRDMFDNISGYFCIIRDVTFQRSYEQIMINAANTDWLTGLFNRRYFYDYLNDHKDDKLTLLYMDLDHFKEVNDIYGHARGDEVLKRTSRIILSVFDEGKVIRLGGDEFAVVLRGEADIDWIKSKIDELEDRVGKIIEDANPPLSISVGYSFHVDGSRSIDDFINEGDTAMYEVKKIHHKNG